MNPGMTIRPTSGATTVTAIDAAYFVAHSPSDDS
jgi:hypothetical protein